MGARLPISGTNRVYREDQRPAPNPGAFRALAKTPATGPFPLPARARIAIRATGAQPGPIALSIGDYEVPAHPMSEGARSIVATGEAGDVVTPYPGFEVQVEIESLDWQTIARC